MSVENDKGPHRLSRHVGEVVRKARKAADLTVEEFASTLSLYGLGRSTSRVAEIERGDFAPTVETLHIIAGAIGQLTGQSTAIADLIPCDVSIMLNDSLVIDGGRLSEELRGAPVELPGRAMPSADDLREALVLQRRADARPRGPWSDDDEIEQENLATHVVLRAIDGLSRADLRVLNAALPNDLNAAMLAALDLWGSLPADERDARAPDGANPQKLGRITRQLADELVEFANRGGSDETEES